MDPRESECYSIFVKSYCVVSGSFAMKPLPDPEIDSLSSLEIIDEESLGEEVNGLAILVDDIPSPGGPFRKFYSALCDQRYGGFNSLSLKF